MSVINEDIEKGIKFFIKLSTISLKELLLFYVGWKTGGNVESCYDGKHSSKSF